MITKLIYGFGDACESAFTILPHIGPAVDFLIIFTGISAIVGWIVYMLKTGKDS